jgi:hypothetical protein
MKKIKEIRMKKHIAVHSVLTCCLVSAMGVIPGGESIDMGNTGYLYNMPSLLPGDAAANFTTVPNYVVNVGQLMGLKADGSAIVNPDNMVPLVSSSIEVVDGAGNSVVAINATGVNLWDAEAAAFTPLSISNGTLKVDSEPVASLAVPVGMPITWIPDMDQNGVNETTLPDGFVRLDGQVLNDPESAYHGMTLPNMNGEAATVVGTTSDVAGGTFVGTNSKALTAAEMPTHSHAATTASAGSHSHARGTLTATDRWVENFSTTSGNVGSTYVQPGWSSDGTTYGSWLKTGEQDDNAGNHALMRLGGREYTRNVQGSTATSGSHTHTVSVGSAGTGSAVDIRQRSMQVVWVMRVK